MVTPFRPAKVTMSLWFLYLQLLEGQNSSACKQQNYNLFISFVLHTDSQYKTNEVWPRHVTVKVNFQTFPHKHRITTDIAMFILHQPKSKGNTFLPSPQSNGPLRKIRITNYTSNAPQGIEMNEQYHFNIFRSSSQSSWAMNFKRGLTLYWPTILGNQWDFKLFNNWKQNFSL